MRVLPHDIRAEEAVIGTLIAYPEALAPLAGMASEDDFHQPAHRSIYRAVVACHAAGGATDIIAIEGALTRAGELSLAGGLEGLSRLSENRTTHAVAHARRVRDLAAARRAIELARDLSEEGESALEDPIAFVDRMASRVAEASSIQRHAVATPAPVIGREFRSDWVSRAEGKRKGLQTRWPNLNAMTSGLQAGEYIVLAARPSCGKSVMGQNIATDAVTRGENGCPALVFSLEMPRLDWWQRAIADISRTDFTIVRGGRMGDFLARNVAEANGRLAQCPLYIDDARGLTISELSARARQWRADPKRGGASEDAIVVVDYLQLVRPSSKPESREQAVAEVSRGLQALAGQLGCPLVVCAQLNRESEKTKRRPMMSDLRESGSIEQDADVIAFIHRPDRMDEKQPKGTTELILEKQRNGPTGIVPMHFEGRYMHFVETTTRQDPP